MIDWKTDDSELARKGRFDQTWMIVKELKDEGEIVNFTVPTGKYECTAIWNNKLYECQYHFTELLNDYTNWAKAHYEDKRANQVNH